MASIMAANGNINRSIAEASGENRPLFPAIPKFRQNSIAAVACFAGPRYTATTVSRM